VRTPAHRKAKYAMTALDEKVLHRADVESFDHSDKSAPVVASQHRRGLQVENV